MRAILAQFTPNIDRALRAAFEFHAPRAVAYARQNAPWTDRTTNARNGLFATVGNGSGRAASGRFTAGSGRGVYSLTLSHGVPYGIWLETRFSGRFAIIRRTIDHEGPELMKTAQRLIGIEMSR